MACFMIPWEVYVPTEDRGFVNARQARIAIKPCFTQQAPSFVELYALMTQYAREMYLYVQSRPRSQARPMNLYVWRVAPNSLEAKTRDAKANVHLANNTMPFVELIYALYSCLNLAILSTFELQTNEASETDDSIAAKIRSRVEQLLLEAYMFSTFLRRLWGFITFNQELASINRHISKEMLDALHGYVIAKLALNKASRVATLGERLLLLCKAFRTLRLCSELAESRSVVDIFGDMPEDAESKPTESQRIIKDFVHLLNLERMRVLSSLGLLISEIEDERALKKFDADITKNFLAHRSPTYQIDKAANTVNASLWYARAAVREIRNMDSSVYQKFAYWFTKRNVDEFAIIHKRFAEVEVCYRNRTKLESLPENIIYGIQCILRTLNDTSVAAVLVDDTLNVAIGEKFELWMSGRMEAK